MNAAKQFTILFMHDNGQTNKFRLGKKTFIFFVTSLIVIPILLVVLSFASYMLFKENRIIHGQLLEQEKVLTQSLSDSQRLAHLEVFLEKENPNSIQQIIEQQKILAEQPSLIINTNPEFAMSQISTEALNAAEESLQLPENAEETGILFNSGLLRIEALSTKLQTNNTRIAINFDLYNSGQQEQIAGDCNFTLLQQQSDNTIKEIPLTKRDGMSFRINKLKKMSTLLQLAEGSINTTATPKDELRLDILIDDVIAYTQIISLQ